MTELCSSDFWGIFGNMGIWSWIGVIFNLVLWVGVIAGLALVAVWLVRRARVPSAAGKPTAKEILRERYARGEITREKYQLMKQEIG